MKIEEILGKREDQRLEFKSAKSLAEPESIAREVVGMLNAEGGTIWIGVEDDKQGAAGAVDPVAAPEREKRRLLDYFLETLEPVPTKDEVVVDVRPWGEGDRGLLEIRVQPARKESGRLPAAFLRRGGRHYLRRMGARNHPMSREEVFPLSVTTGRNDAVESAFHELARIRQELPDSRRSGLWLGLLPVRRITIDLESEEGEKHLRQIALEPWVTANRRAGVHFVMTNRPPRMTHQGFEWGWWSDIANDFVSRVTVKENGALVFWASLVLLLEATGGLRELEGREGRELDPLALLELPISAFRIARVVYAEYLRSDDQVAADLALLGVGGWLLRKGSPLDPFFLIDRPDRVSRQEEADLIWEPLPLTFGEIDEAPDLCGFRLVRRIYRSFGFGEEDMPRQYDRGSRRLILPE